jgi:hypothetical protein
MHARLEGGALNASGELTLSAPYRYSTQVHLSGMDLARLDRLSPDLRLPVSVAGSLDLEARPEGTLRPTVLNVSGSARARDLNVDGVPIDSLRLDWVRNPSEWLVSDLRARLFDGEITGSVTLPVAVTAQGAADLQLQHVDAQAFGKAFPAVPVRLEGRVSGSISGRLAAAAPGRPRALSAKIELKAPQLRVQGIATERVTGSIDYQPPGAASYRLEGESLGGRFKLEGKLPPRLTAPAEKPGAPPANPPDGRLQVEGVRLGRLWRVYHLQDTLGPLQGAFALDLPFRHVGADRHPEGEGRFQIANLRWDSEDIAPNLQGDVRLTREGLEVRDLTGSLTQGIARLSFLAPLEQNRGGWFTLSLLQVEASRLLLPWPSLAGRVQGPVDVALRGRLGTEWNGGGTVVFGPGRLAGIDVTEWNLPVQFAFAPRQGRGDLTVSDSYATVAHGRVLGRADVTFSDGARVDGHLRFFDVDLHTLLASAGDVGSIASGRLSGRLDLGGTNVHSVNDLTGTLTANLRQSQAMQLPVLRQITPYLRLGMSSETFHTGDIEARLDRGVVRLQRFNLQGGLFQLVIQGTVNLDGRLNLDVYGRTGNVTLLPPALRLLGLRIPLIGPIPLSVIREASLLLARSSIHLRVTGSIRNPVVQVQPLALLTEEAVRYFLLRVIIPAP